MGEIDGKEVMLMRRDLFKAILGGIGAIFLPKLDKKSDYPKNQQKEDKLNRVMRIDIKRQSSPNFTVSINGDENCGTVTCCGVCDENGLYICELIDGKPRIIYNVENKSIIKYHVL